MEETDQQLTDEERVQQRIFARVVDNKRREQAMAAAIYIMHGKPEASASADIAAIALEAVTQVRSKETNGKDF